MMLLLLLLLLMMMMMMVHLRFYTPSSGRASMA